MSSPKRSDVKNHLHPPFHAKLHLVQPESQSDATGFPGAEPNPINANAETFTADFVAEHSSSDLGPGEGDPLNDSIGPPELTRSKSVQS